MSLVFAHKDSRRTINLRMLLKVSGWLLVIEALFMCVPAAVSFGYGESDAYPLIIIAGITAFVGWLMQTIRAHSSYMGRREAYCNLAAAHNQHAPYVAGLLAGIAHQSLDIVRQSGHIQKVALTDVVSTARNDYLVAALHRAYMKPVGGLSQRLE